MATANDAATIKRNILLLFERPTEPAFIPRGDSDNRTLFDIPANLLPERYKTIVSQLSNRFDDVRTRVAVKDITPPDISVPQQLGRHEQFSLFIPRHREMAGRLIDIFLGMQGLDDFQSAAVFCREHLNPYLFNYALSVALLHRGDTRDIPIPNIIETFPAKYFDSSLFARAREEVGIVPDGSRAPIVIPRDWTGTDLDPEHRLAYFREDIGINLHHWHWHLVYPFTANNRDIVNKDRRGELFYYMHRQFLSRYNVERFCNRMARVIPFSDLTQPIAEGYFPKLESNVAGRAWPPRFVNARLSNVNRPNDGLQINIDDLGRWRDTLQRAIVQRFVVDANNTQIPLTEERGIDILGNIIESSTLNPNSQLYGDIHNMGHLLIAYAHDPDNRFLESFSVMGDAGTAMRDPMFYRWHAYIENLFDVYKATLDRYTRERLDFPGIRVSGLRVDVEGGRPNELQTFWQQSDLNLARGLDFGRSGAVYVRFTHLQHLPFTYNIRIDNSTRNQVWATVRIFIGPVNDERGVRLTFEEQRVLMIELDRFTVRLNQGPNDVVRRSIESSVTIPYETTFRNLNAGRPAANAPGELPFNFCGCGWPDHMLLPRGTEEGYPMELFVMVSNFANDGVQQTLDGNCNEAQSFCGLLNRLYPDRQAMGYPFDRPGANGVITLTDMLTPNMSVVPVRVLHVNRTTLRAQTQQPQQVQQQQ